MMMSAYREHLREMERRIEHKSYEVRKAVAALKARQKTGNNSEVFCWIVPEQLAAGPRPLRYHQQYGGGGHNLYEEATPDVKNWARLARDGGIKSIICLMHARDLKHYEGLDMGTDSLIEFYKLSGFDVAHLPWQDTPDSRAAEHLYRKKLIEIRERALEEYEKLPKPVMVQCSAGVDRTAPVAGYIWARKTLLG
jgi:hypothetical protein